jgi:hypothetical protein
MSSGTPLRLTFMIVIWAVWVQITGLAIASEKKLR